VSRFDDLGIAKVVEGASVSVYSRENCVAMVGTTQGSTGIMTEHGLAFLVWRDGVPILAAKGAEMPATPEQVEAIRQFTEDLKTALSQ
jgi:hypothetical protein